MFIAFVLVLKAPAQTQGIDVSKYQGKIKWERVAKNKKVKFVYIRATEGATIQDECQGSSQSGIDGW